MATSIQLRWLKKGESLPMGLLLQADPNRELVAAYCDKGEILVAELKAGTVGVCAIVFDEENGIAEIKNISVLDSYQNEGIGKRLITSAEQFCKNKGIGSLRVGTGNSSLIQIAFYQKCGFRMSEIVKDYFIKNYPNPIYENGIQCIDLLYFEKSL